MEKLINNFEASAAKVEDLDESVSADEAELKEATGVREGGSRFLRCRG